MKKLILLLITLYSMSYYSQVDTRTELDKRVSKIRNERIDLKTNSPYYSKEEYKVVANIEKKTFQEIALPNENSELSQFLKRYLTIKDLKKINYHSIKSSYFFEIDPYKLANYDHTIRFTFEIGKKSKLKMLRVRTGNRELDKKIKKIFPLFPLQKLKLTNKNKSGKISVQLFERNEKRKTIIKASANAVYDERPTIEECNHLKTWTDRYNCFYRKLFEHITSNMSLKVIEKQKERGDIKIYPRFSISSDGRIYNVNSIAPNKVMKNELDRVIKTFNNKIIPAKRNNTPKDFLYETTCLLTIEENNQNK